MTFSSKCQVFHASLCPPGHVGYMKQPSAALSGCLSGTLRTKGDQGILHKYFTLFIFLTTKHTKGTKNIKIKHKKSKLLLKHYEGCRDQTFCPVRRCDNQIV